MVDTNFNKNELNIFALDDKSFLETDFTIEDLIRSVDIMNNQNEQTSSSWLLPSAEGYVQSMFSSLSSSMAELRIEISDVNSYVDKVESIDRAQDDFIDLMSYMNFPDNLVDKFERGNQVLRYYSDSCALTNAKTSSSNSLTGGAYLHYQTNRIREILYSELVTSCNQKLAAIKNKASLNYKSFLTNSSYSLGVSADNSIIVKSSFQQILKELNEIEEKLNQADRLTSISVRTRELSSKGKRLFLSSEDVEKMNQLSKKISKVKKFVKKLIDRIEWKTDVKLNLAESKKNQKFKNILLKSKLADSTVLFGSPKGEINFSLPKTKSQIKNRRPIWSFKGFRGGFQIKSKSLVQKQKIRLKTVTHKLSRIQLKESFRIILFFVWFLIISQFLGSVEANINQNSSIDVKPPVAIEKIQKSASIELLEISNNFKNSEVGLTQEEGELMESEIVNESKRFKKSNLKLKLKKKVSLNDRTQTLTGLKKTQPDLFENDCINDEIITNSVSPLSTGRIKK